MMDYGASSSNIRYIKEPGDKTHVTAFLQLNISSFSEEAVDNLLDNYRITTDSKYILEHLICITDARSIPDELVKKLLKFEKISIVHSNDPKHACLSDHFWRFSTYKNKSVKFFSSFQENCVNLQNSPENSQKDQENGTDTCLVFSNYHKSKENDIKHLIKLIVDNIRPKMSDGITFGKIKNKHCFVSFRDNNVCSIVITRLQSCVLHILPEELNLQDDEEHSPIEIDTPENDQMASNIGTLNQNPLQQHNFRQAYSAFSKKLLDPDFQISHPSAGDLPRELVIFWDVQNCNIKSDKTATYFVERIKNKFVTPGYTLEAFVSVYDVWSDNDEFLQRLYRLGVTVIHRPTEEEQTADRILIPLIQMFSTNRPRKAKVVLISSDSDFADVLEKVIEQNDISLVYRQNNLHRFPFLGTHAVHAIEDFLPVNNNKKTSLSPRALLQDVDKQKTSLSPRALLTDVDKQIPERFKKSVKLVQGRNGVALICDNKMIAERTFHELYKKYGCKVLKIVKRRDSFFNQYLINSALQ